MSEEYCDSDENIIRAVHYNFFDQDKKILSKSVFLSDEPISVNRLKVLSLKEISVITVRDLKSIVALAEVRVGDVKKAGTDLGQQLEVISKPVTQQGIENPSHAEIHGKITDGIANRIRKACKKIYNIDCNLIVG